MLRGLKGISLFLCASCCIFGQTAPPPAFDAASVKPNTSGSVGGRSETHKGQIVFTNVTLQRIVLEAYNVKDFRLVGPDWLTNVRFDVTAKYPGDTTTQQRRLMQQTLLAERFHLAIHRESKEMPAFALVAAKNGPKLEAGKPGSGTMNTSAARIEDTGISMAGLADQLARQLERPVADKTGLTGVYNLKLEWTPDDQSAGKGEGEPALGASIYSALQDQLGLKLQTQKLPVEVIVVDHIGRIPTEN